MTRLNGKSYTINALYIETVESCPDTTITLTNGKKLVVSEKEVEIIQAITRFYRVVNILGLCKDKEESDDEK